MDRKAQIFGVSVLVMALTATPPAAQEGHPQADPLVAAARDASAYMEDMLIKAADQMSEEDYAFRPTPEVRSFGQLLAHIADSNYMFCSTVRGEEPPARSVERTLTRRAEIQRALAESFDYCEEAYSGLTEARAKSIVSFMGDQRPILAVLFFSTHHGALHYGNVITYMRLRGKVPPSSQAG